MGTKFKIAYVTSDISSKFWYDDDFELSSGFHFPLKITNSQAPEGSELYFSFNLMNSPAQIKSSFKQRTKITSIWLYYDSFIISDTNEGLLWWKKLLIDKVDAEFNVLDNMESPTSNSYNLQVLYPKAERCCVTNIISLNKGEDEFVEKVYTYGTTILTRTNLPEALFKEDSLTLVKLLPESDLLEAYERFNKLSEIFSYNKDNDEQSEDEDEDNEYNNYDESGPSDEELRAIESGEEK